MVGVNRAMARIRHSSRAGDLGRDIFEKENLNKKVNKKNQTSVPGFWFRSANWVGPGSGVATLLLSIWYKYCSTGKNKKRF